MYMLVNIIVIIGSSAVSVRSGELSAMRRFSMPKKANGNAKISSTNTSQNLLTCLFSSPPFSSCSTVQTKAELHGARYAILSEDESRLHGSLPPLLPTDPPEIDGCCLEHPITTVPPDVLSQLYQMNVLQKDAAVDHRSVWRACSYSFSLSKGTFYLDNGETPTRRQLQALSRALACEIMQCVPPNMSVPEGGLVFEPVIMDSSTGGTAVQWLQKLTTGTKNIPLLKRSSDSTPASSSSKKQKTDEETPEKVRQPEKPPQNVPVKSFLELERELNKSAHRRLMDRVYHDADGFQSPSSQSEELQEAESMLETARQQLQNKTLDEERIIHERTELDAALCNKCRACDEEYLQVENQMKALQAQVDWMHQQRI